MINADYHTHTKYSHGKGAIEDNVKAAALIGLKGIAITDHGFAHKKFGISDKKLPLMRGEIESLKQKYKLDIYLGVEANLISLEGGVDLKTEKFEKLDVFLMGCHKYIIFESLKDAYNLLIKNYFTSVFRIKPPKSIIKANTSAYIKAIEKYPLDVITHLNYEANVDICEVAKAARDYGTYIEISAKKGHLTPVQINKIADIGAEFIINSDAHSPSRVGDFELAVNLLRLSGVSASRVCNAECRSPRFRFAEYKLKNL